MAKSKECGELFGSKVQGVFFVGFPKILWHFKIATSHKFTIFFQEIHLMAIPPLEATKIWKKIMEFLEGVISLSRLIHTCRNHLHLLPHFFGWLFVATKKTSQSSGKKIWWISKGPSQKETSQQPALVFFQTNDEEQTPRFLCPNWFWRCRTQLTIPSFFSSPFALGMVVISFIFQTHKNPKIWGKLGKLG